MNKFFFSQTNVISGLFAVEFEVGRAAYIPSGLYLAQGEVKLHCIGAKEIKHLIFWSKNGVKQTGAKFHESEHESNVQSIYKVGVCLYVRVYTVQFKMAKLSFQQKSQL
jgi:hypothetical protein